VTMSTVKAVPASYRVSGDTGKIAIVWKADALQIGQTTADVTTLAPAAFAGLVAHCSGVPLQIEDTAGAKRRQVAQLLERSDGA